MELKQILNGLDSRPDDAGKVIFLSNVYLQLDILANSLKFEKSSTPWVNVLNDEIHDIILKNLDKGKGILVAKIESIITKFPNDDDINNSIQNLLKP